MPILGVIASSTRQGQTTDTGSMFPLGVVTVPSGQTTISFSSIPQTYTHLQIRYIAANQAASGDDPIYIRFNSDATNANYRSHRFGANGASLITDGYQQPIGSTANGNGNAATYYTAGVVDILDYRNTNKNKTIRSFSGWDANGSGNVYLISELWMNSAAITTIDITLFSSGTYRQYTQFALYGIKA